jgi:hypothetical protein
MRSRKLLPFVFGLALSAAGLQSGRAETPYKSNADFAKYAMRLRESAISSLEPTVIVPTHSRPLFSASSTGGAYAWKTGIVTTVFWVGEAASANNPVHNRSSSWDLNWATSYGGYDNPEPSARKNYMPVAFTPKQNPFYFALPYNDVTHGNTKPEARRVIPWFAKTWVKEGQSVCHDRWIAIKNPSNGKVCYAQWSDCGPFRTDHWEYVFGNDRPKPNLNQGAGLDISPAVRDFLGVGSKSVLDWKFVEFGEIPKGPWSTVGDNNTFVQLRGKSAPRLVSANPTGSSSGPASARVLTK